MDCIWPATNSELFGPCAHVPLFNIWTQHQPWLALSLGVGLVLAIVSIRRWLRQNAHNHLAHFRAEKLLHDSLPPSQYHQLQQNGYLQLPSRLDPNRVYHVPRHRGRVQVYELCLLGQTQLSRKIAELCVIPCEPVPDADVLLAHKWMIEADEAGYLALANWIRAPHNTWMTVSHEGQRLTRAP